MRVLEQGRKQEGWSKEAECTGKGNGGGGCGAKLLVERKDLFTTQRSCRDETEYFVTFQCSECQVLTDLVIKPHNFFGKLPKYSEWKKLIGIK